MISHRISHDFNFAINWKTQQSNCSIGSKITKQSRTKQMALDVKQIINSLILLKSWLIIQTIKILFLLFVSFQLPIVHFVIILFVRYTTCLVRPIQNTQNNCILKKRAKYTKFAPIYTRIFTTVIHTTYAIQVKSEKNTRSLPKIYVYLCYFSFFSYCISRNLCEKIRNSVLKSFSNATFWRAFISITKNQTNTIWFLGSRKK